MEHFEHFWKKKKFYDSFSFITYVFIIGRSELFRQLDPGIFGNVCWYYEDPMIIVLFAISDTNSCDTLHSNAFESDRSCITSSIVKLSTVHYLVANFHAKQVLINLWIFRIFIKNTDIKYGMPYSACFIKYYAFLRQFDVNSDSIVVCGIEWGEKTQIVIYCKKKKRSRRLDAINLLACFAINYNRPYDRSMSTV